ncbi:hypothetical protein [Caloranaerobacter ferrireducens]|nr:hypothetical protein [Caloranaerobacter ferrireducens]
MGKHIYTYSKNYKKITNSKDKKYKWTDKFCKRTTKVIALICGMVNNEKK